MIAVIQRTNTPATVAVDHEIVGKISRGLVILLGVNKGDTEKDAQLLAKKILHLRIFSDEMGKMNLSLKTVSGEALIISQFTLSGDCKKGRRPGFDKAEKPERARELYHYFTRQMEAGGIHCETGKFGAHMAVSLINDGPVTFILDSKEL
jgi:D-tyrosyl-tRNA(Tyr) deacylase